MTTAEIRSRQSAHRLYIGGAWRDARGSGRLAVLNPATGQQIAEVAAAGVEDVDAAVTAAHEAFTSGRWSGLTPGQRSDILFKLAELMAAEAEELAQLESTNTGKPITNARYFAGACRVVQGLGQAEYLQGYQSTIPS